MTMIETARDYPFHPADRLEIDPQYAELRREGRLIRVRLPYGEEAWLATRYADVKVVMGDQRFSRAHAVGRDEPRTMPAVRQTGMLAMDPPEHTRLRTLVAKAFTARRVDDLRPRTQQIADALVDRIIAHGPPADLVESFAAPLPITVICELIGVPEPDRSQFAIWAEAIISTTSLTPEQIEDYFRKMYAYVGGLIGQRRQQPTDDLLGAMVRVRDEQDGRLTEEELVQLAAGLIAAGQETTVTQLPNLLYVLLTRPALWERLRAEPELLPAAVEELMRWIPLGVAAAIPRYATVDVELGGVLVRAGEPVLAALHSANRDEAAFDDPDLIDFTREGRPHFGFGHGAHHCIGAQLARMELQVAVGTLLRRMPALRFAVPEEQLVWKNGMLIRGLAALPVVW